MEQINLKARFALIAMVTATLVVAYFVSGVRLGQDLKGGTTLRFSLDLDRAEKEGRIDPGADRETLVTNTIRVIQDRIDKYGLAETGLVPLGEGKFEISLPAGSEGEVQAIVDVVTALGDLEFRIEVLPRERYSRWREGEEPPRLSQPESWPWKDTAAAFDEFKKNEVAKWVEADSTATAYVPTDPRYFVVRKEDAQGNDVQDFALLEQPEDPRYRFDGGILSNPVTGPDEKGKPAVFYDVKTYYQNFFAKWTGENVGLPMAIVLNERYRTAPIINSELRDRVQITLGSGPWSELQKEAEQIATVLQTGSLKVRPKLESVNKTGARLAGESKDRGVYATILSLALTLGFMILYYRATGMVANLALLLNGVLIVGTMAFFEAVLTLPGIAGIALTLGMAVDSNILINERIREERMAGRSLRRAVHEGYDRALTTIIDANATTLITGVFLYAYGSGSVRGFAITLMIGIFISVFTAVYMTRAVNEWLMRRGWLAEIRMLGRGIPPRIPWVRLRRVFAPVSALGVVFGLAMFFGEDPYTLYDVDFTGGFKLQARFQEPTTVDDVRGALSGEARTVEVTLEDFDAEGKKQVVTRSVRAGPYPAAEVVSIGEGGEAAEITVQRGVVAEAEVGAETDDTSLEVQRKAFEGFVRQALADRLNPSWLRKGPEPFATAPADDAALKPVEGGKYVRVTFVDPAGAVTGPRLEQAVTNEMPFWIDRGNERERRPASAVRRTVVARPVEESHTALRTFDLWMLSKNATSDETVETGVEQVKDTLLEFLGGQRLRDALVKGGVPPEDAESVGLSEPFPSVDVIGSSVAQRLKNDALIALVLSLMGIILYVAFRFSSRAMGLAAVLCLFHDVAVTLGVVAVANLLGLVDAKINMPMVAAFLTLVGYSVNDTVVIFDRIRENRGKKREITPEMIDLSINQTWARSIRTNITFFFACLALFVLNIGQRNVLEGFSFLLIVGAVVGTYSTVAIASPLLLFIPWFEERIRFLRPRFALIGYPASHWTTVLLTPVAAVLWAMWGLLFAAVALAAGIVMFPVWALVESVEPATVTEPA